MTSDLKSAILEANRLEIPNGLKPLNNFAEVINSLNDALQDAIEWCLDEDLIVQAEKLVKKLDQTLELHRAMTSLQEVGPMRSQQQFVKYVYPVEKSIEDATATGVEPALIQYAQEMIVQARMEYWLSVRMERLKPVERAVEANEHDMNALRKTIERALSIRANDELTQRAIALLRRLDSELEIFRAIAAIPPVRLPPPEPIEDYWQEEDLGHIKETEGFPYLPPDSTEYLWEHSRTYIALSSCIDRLRSSITSADINTNPVALAEVKERLSRVEKDMKILEAKDASDRQAAVDAAVKALKKLKRLKKKQATGSPTGKRKS